MLYRAGFYFIFALARAQALHIIYVFFVKIKRYLPFLRVKLSIKRFYLLCFGK